MITIAQELLCEVVQEVQPLLEDHYAELTLHKDVVKLDPRWDEYATLERMGRFAVFTVRDDEKLAGYSAFFLNRHLHYSALFVAQNDVYWVGEQYRHGSTALRLVRYAEQAIKRMGAHKIVYHCKTSNQFAPILRRLGYADEELMLGKMI